MIEKSKKKKFLSLPFKHSTGGLVYHFFNAYSLLFYSLWEIYHSTKFTYDGVVAMAMLQMPLNSFLRKTLVLADPLFSKIFYEHLSDSFYTRLPDHESAFYYFQSFKDADLKCLYDFPFDAFVEAYVRNKNFSTFSFFEVLFGDNAIHNLDEDLVEYFVPSSKPLIIPLDDDTDSESDVSSDDDDEEQLEQGFEINYID